VRIIDIMDTAHYVVKCSARAKSKLHLDGVILSPTMSVDGRPLIEDGTLRVLGLAKT